MQAGGRIDAAALERDQFAVRSFAWTATYVAGLRAMLGWARRLETADGLAEIEQAFGGNGGRQPLV